MKDSGVDGKIILIWIFGKLDEGMDRIGQVVGSCECGNERSCSINCGEFLD